VTLIEPTTPTPGATVSSSATTESATAIDTPVVAPAPAAPPDPAGLPGPVAADPLTADLAPDHHPMVDTVDVSYGRAIVVGSIVGIVVFSIAMWVVVKALAPEWPAGAAAGIAGWCGLWSGLFLGGTIAVGRWSLRQGH
jgi:hypothetical protein